MPRFKVNQKIKMPVIMDGKSKKIFYPESETQFETEEFTIIGINPHYEEYFVQVNPDMLGYSISSWDTLHFHVDKKHEGSKFWFVQYHQADQYN
jgi:hypothetical protein